ncbi:MAG TPA: hypothetical protein P5519_00360, partial [Spirochaetia bacterium]|nr:hypothetical protein [Spirochaetia bacterium]
APETAEDATDDAAPETAEDAADDAAPETAEDATDDAAPETAEDAADDAAAVTAKDAADDAAPETAEDAADDAAAGTAEDAADESAAEGSEDIAQDSSQEHEKRSQTVESGPDEMDTTDLSEINTLSDYMNTHNYGPDDFSTYSQDPQWRQLMRQEYPNYELPPIAQESAMQQLSNYMNENNYGREDFATYSKDPTWRELTQYAFPDYEFPGDHAEGNLNADALANGVVSDDTFSQTDYFDDDLSQAGRLEDLSKADYELLKTDNPQKASQLLTDYNDRNLKRDGLADLSRNIDIDNNANLSVVDKELSRSMATIRDAETEQEYTVYPNPMDRTAHMMGQQGQNDLGMHQDCGIASTAKSINDLYGKTVTSENRLADYAYATNNCDISRMPNGGIDIYNSGGTWEGNVKEFYEANGLSADAYSGDAVLSLDELGERLKNGEGATLAVNHDLMWNFDEAQSVEVDTNRYAIDPKYAARMDIYMDMKDGTGVFKADHYVNVSNAVYNKEGELTHFIVSDTGNGTTKMLSKEYLQRAYNGLGNISVSAQGCVVARKE